MELTSLTFGGYSLVYNMFSFTIAAMLASGLFFILAQHRLRVPQSNACPVFYFNQRPHPSSCSC